MSRSRLQFPKNLSKGILNQRTTLAKGEEFGYFTFRGSDIVVMFDEAFDGKLRDELLSREIFTSLTEAKILVEEWWKEYNQVRPHSALNYRPPTPDTFTFVPLTLT